MAGVRKRLISQDVSMPSQPGDSIVGNEDIIQILEEVQQEATCSKLLQLDMTLTQRLSVREEMLENKEDSPVYLTLLIHCILCEIGGSLLFLLPLTLLLILTSPHLSHFTFYTNLLQAQILDSVVKVAVKVAVRRQQEEPLASQFPGISHFSFPSGHCSRMAMLGYILIKFSPKGALFFLFVAMSVITVSVSRVVLGRHFISDMLGGIVTGIVNGALFVAFFWTEEQALAEFFEIRSTALDWVDGVIGSIL